MPWTLLTHVSDKWPNGSTTPLDGGKPNASGCPELLRSFTWLPKRSARVVNAN